MQSKLFYFSSIAGEQWTHVCVCLCVCVDEEYSISNNGKPYYYLLQIVLTAMRYHTQRSYTFVSVANNWPCVCKLISIVLHAQIISHRRLTYYIV